MLTSEKTDKILPKLFNVKGKIESVKKSSSNPYFKSKYADLKAHLELVEPLLQEEGLILLQPTELNPATGGNMATSSILDKESGQFVKAVLNLIGESDMQKSGAAVTYGRRFTLNALLALITDDDDGETAVGRGQTKTVAPKAKAVETAKTVTKAMDDLGAAGSSSQANEGLKGGSTTTRSSFRKPAKPVSNGDDL